MTVKTPAFAEPEVIWWFLVIFFESLVYCSFCYIDQTAADKFLGQRGCIITKIYPVVILFINIY